MRQRFKGVIFDIDGLMLDTEPIFWKSMQQASVELGYNLDAELQNNFIGRSIPEWRDTLVRTFGEDYPRFRTRRRELWEHHIQKIGVEQKAGLAELLDLLDEQRLTKAIATSSTKPDALLCLGP